MTYKPDDFEVFRDDPFLNDALDRKGLVNFLVGIVEKASGPFVLAVDAQWGEGKTTVIRMMQAVLEKRSYQTIYFNAWQVDYVVDPLVAMVAAIDDLKKSDGSVEKNFDSLKKVTSILAKRGAVAATKMLTLGVIDLDDEMEAAVAEFAGGSVDDVVGAFQQEKKCLSNFRGLLEKVVSELDSRGKKGSLVFFIDELDRCRPSFAIELLERIKHLFDVKNIIFVLSIDKYQLQASTAAVYGSGVDAAEYLRKFIDVEFLLPRASNEKFVEAMIGRFGFDEFFSSRIHRSFIYDREQLVASFSMLANIFGLSLRAQERCFTRLRIVFDQTPSDHYLDPVLVALLIVLRVKNKDLFVSLCAGVSSSDDVMNYLGAMPHGEKFRSSHQGHFLEASLIAADWDGDRKNGKVDALRKSSSDASRLEYLRARDTEVLSILPEVFERRRSVDLRKIAAKVDMAAHVKD